MHAGRSILLLVFVLLMCTPLFFCDTSSTVDAPGDDDDDTAAPDDDDDGPPDTTPPDAPEVDDPTSPTGLSYQSIHGAAEAGSLIYVTGGLADAEAQTNADGEFCVKVALQPEVVNTLQFVAEDAAGNRSDSSSVVIEQHTDNYSLSSTVEVSSTSSTKPNNTADKAIDGNYLTWWENTTNPINEGADYQPQWIGVKMQQEYWINRVEIHWGRDALSGDYEYGTKFDVYLNTNDNVAKMPHELGVEDPADYGYVLLETVEQAADLDIQNNSIDLEDAPVEGRWVFLFLHESNRPNAVFTGKYSFEVAELEAYGFKIPDDPCE